jgi:hypothetical protein
LTEEPPRLILRVPLYREVRFTPLAALGRMLIYVREVDFRPDCSGVEVTHYDWDLLFNRPPGSFIYRFTAYLPDLPDGLTQLTATMMLWDHSDLLMAKSHASTVKT